jgi:alpha-tubulin suppressor-like RCC1 family protein
MLGNGELANSLIPVPVTGLSMGVTAISAGSLEACALAEDHSVWCWGYGDEGELGDGQQDAGLQRYTSGVAVKVDGLPVGGAIFISSGGAPCAVTTSGGVDCWGATSDLAYSPVPVSNVTGAVSVSVGGVAAAHQFACAVGTQSANFHDAPASVTYCWGDNTYGQLGNGTENSASQPVLSMIGAATAISAGGYFACGILGGEVECWGNNSSGELGNGTTQASDIPVPVQGLPSGEATSVSAGLNGACALMSNGSVYCWGDNTNGQLGNGTTEPSQIATPVVGLTEGVTALSVGTNYACALLADETVDCWGSNDVGQLGNGTETAYVPTPVPGLAGVTAISAGPISACAVAEGAIQCWGSNAAYTVSTSSAQIVFSPTPLSVLTSGATQVSVGTASACAIANGGAWCWGNNAIGDAKFQTGIFTGPLAVTGLASGVTGTAAGYASACAVTGDGGVECWGDNGVGVLGNGSAVDHFTATPVAGFP